ncbi:putative F-box-WD repeat-containing protein, partial [Naja naja]
MEVKSDTTEDLQIGKGYTIEFSNTTTIVYHCVSVSNNDFSTSAPLYKRRGNLSQAGRNSRPEERRPTRARQAAAAAFPLLILSLPGPAGKDHPSMGRPSSPPQAEIRSPLWALPEELLLLICSYLDARALGRLGQTCRRLFRFTCRDVLWRRLARLCLNAGFSALGADLVLGVPVKERVKVSQNWRLGRCRRIPLLRWKRKQVIPFLSSPYYLLLDLMPWMQLDGDYLYLSQAEDIHLYWLHPKDTNLVWYPQTVFSGHREDVCRFVVDNGHIISGGGDGNIALHKLNGSFSFKILGHQQEVNCVDCQESIIVSGSRDRTAKVWSLLSGRAGQCLHTIQTEDRVWSIAISPLLRCMKYSSVFNMSPYAVDLWKWDL